MKETLLAEAARLGIALDAPQLARFESFAQALVEQNRVMNLTAITEPREIALLHFADSLALLRAADFRGKTVIDVGCGAGFPGVPLKIGEPSLQLTLLDSLQKRVAWLNRTLTALDIEADCVASRAEDYAARERFDIAVSRAVARLNVLCELCLPFVRVGGCFLAMKAAAVAEELREAQRAIALLGAREDGRFDYTLGGASRSILVLRKVRPTPQTYPRRFARIKISPL